MARRKPATVPTEATLEALDSPESVPPVVLQMLDADVDALPEGVLRILGKIAKRLLTNQESSAA